MDLERPGMNAVGHVADEHHHRNAIEQGLADAGERIGQTRPGHDAQDAGCRATASKYAVRDAVRYPDWYSSVPRLFSTARCAGSA